MESQFTYEWLIDQLAESSQGIEKLERAFSWSIGYKPFGEKDAKRGYAPSSIEGFLKVISKIRGIKSINSFVDLGCGIGSKCAIARIMGINDVSGVEIHPEMLKVANVLSKRHNFYVHNQDINHFDFSGYDIIYLFYPIDGTPRFTDNLLDKLNKNQVIVSSEESRQLSIQNPKYIAKFDNFLIKSKDTDFIRAIDAGNNKIDEITKKWYQVI